MMASLAAAAAATLLLLLRFQITSHIHSMTTILLTWRIRNALGMLPIKKSALRLIQ